MLTRLNRTVQKAAAGAAPAKSPVARREQSAAQPLAIGRFGPLWTAGPAVSLGAVQRQPIPAVQRFGQPFGHEAAKIPNSVKHTPKLAMKRKQEAIAQAVTTVKAEEKQAKAKLEQTKNETMEDSTLDEQERHNYLWNTYVPALRRIGITPDKVQAKLADNDLAFATTGQTTEISYLSKVIYRFYTGSDAFAEDDSVTGTARKVYTKKGSEGKHYVQDDRGIFTRRLAYAEKSDAQVAKLKGGETLKGRAAERDGGIFKKTNRLKAEFDFDTSDTQNMSVPEMLLVHQELGSGAEQRGVSIASTNKLVHGNKGEPFYSKGGSTLQIDLAKVPTGANMLYNLYANAAQTNLTKGFNRYEIGLDKDEAWERGDRQFTADQMKAHTNTSTAKNRELFLKELKPEWVVGATAPHPDNLPTAPEALTDPQWASK